MGDHNCKYAVLHQLLSTLCIFFILFCSDECPSDCNFYSLECFVQTYILEGRENYGGEEGTRK